MSAGWSVRKAGDRTSAAKTPRTTGGLEMEAETTHGAQWLVLGSPRGCGAVGPLVQMSCRPPPPARGAGAARGESACNAIARIAPHAAMRIAFMRLMRFYTTSICNDT